MFTIPRDFTKRRDPVERIGVERAVDAIDDADLVLVVVDDRDAASGVDTALLERAGAAPAGIVVRNKIDLSRRQPGLAHRRASHGDGTGIRAQGDGSG